MMEALATSNDWRIRYENFLRLRELGPKVIAEQAEALEGFSRSRYPWMRKLALEAMAVMDPQDLAMHSNVVAERLRDTDDDVCYEAIRTMKRLQPEILEKHAAILSRLLADEDWNVRLAALSALARLEPLKLSHYAEAIQDRCGDEVHQVSELAQKVWARLLEELPRLVVTCRREQGCCDGLRVSCVSMAGNELMSLLTTPESTCDELRQKAAEVLKVPKLQLKLLTPGYSGSRPQELVGSPRLADLL